jgi:taurine dioxygenase
MALEFTSLHPDLGMQIQGFDIEHLGDAEIAAFRSAFDEHHLVLLRGVDLSEQQQTRLTELLGEVSFESPVMKKGGERKFSFIGNQHSDGTLRDGELLFHSDHTFFKLPLKAIALYSLAVPSQGGETVFANAARAYQRLPQALKDRIAGLQARHVANYGTFDGEARPRFDPASRAKVAVQPLVWRHPDSGEKILFVSRLLTESILDMPYAASEALLQELFIYIEDPAHLYVHQWRVGDYLVWDNRQLQHSRRDFDPNEKRALRRIPIAQPDIAA